MDPEEDEIFTRKTSGNCECDPNFFEEKKQERGKKKNAGKGKRRVESNRSHWAKFPVAAVSGSHGKGCRVYDGSAHTRIGGPFPGNEKP